MARAQQLAVSVSFYRFAAAHRSYSCQGSFIRDFDIPYQGTMKAKDGIRLDERNGQIAALTARRRQSSGTCQVP